jgi:hypothetical protein
MDNYLPLPDRFETNEYYIMERFCASVNDGIQDDLGKATRGHASRLTRHCLGIVRLHCERLPWHL